MRYHVVSIGLPEGFSRLAAVNGGVYMLNKGVDEILLNEDGVAWGIKTDNEVNLTYCHCCVLFPSVGSYWPLLYCSFTVRW